MSIKNVQFLFCFVLLDAFSFLFCFVGCVFVLFVQLSLDKFCSSTQTRVIEMFAKEIRYSVVCQCPGVVGIKKIIRGLEGWLIVQELVEGGVRLFKSLW